VTVYRHGFSCGVGNPNPHPGERGEVQGWSAAAVRRNLQFLYSVDETKLPGMGYALTLTVRDCPSSGQEWTRFRDCWIKRQRREGLQLLHWVTEWQARGAPHLHCAAWWSGSDDQHLRAIHDWLELTAANLLVAIKGQHVTPIYDPLGWSQYVSKHAARGHRHYQRQAVHIPEAWRGQSTGRLWGHLGSWPLRSPAKLGTDWMVFYQARRVLRSWRIADARASGSARRLVSARGCLRCPFPDLSRVRGLSEWFPEDLAMRVLEGLSQAGGYIESI